MSDILLSTVKLTKRFGGLVANDAIDLQVRRGGLHAIIGPNGAGKTTLVAQLSGELRPDGGTINFDGADVTALPVHQRARRGFGRSFQITNVVRELSALDNVALAVQAHDGHSFRFWRPARRDESLREPARRMLEKVELADRADILAGHLSHGEKRALEVAMALASRPKLLLLDEPLAGMGPDESIRMARLLETLKAEVTILLVEHDVEIVFALADRITVLVSGRIIAQGIPAAIRVDPEVQRAYLGDGATP
jgi:branched-chain amino acid transport system ATP-binding protein